MMQDASLDQITAQQLSGSYCFGCLKDLKAQPDASSLTSSPGVVVSCPDCHQLFCFDCDAFVHEVLHNCPGCECGLRRQQDDGPAPMDVH